MDHQSQTTCLATTKQGRRCRKHALEDGLCLFHSGKLDLVELGRKGGKARGRKQEEPGDRLERIAFAAIEELLLSSGNATARASAARLVVDKLSASSSLSAELARRAASEDMPTVRAKLERLIESRAEARARELTAELERRTAEAEARLAALTG
jgi:hypothetical protein